MEFKILIQTKNIHLVRKNKYSASSNLFKPATFVKKMPLMLRLVDQEIPVESFVGSSTGISVS